MDPIRSLSEQFNDVGQGARLREARIVARLGAEQGHRKSRHRAGGGQDAVSELKSRSDPVVEHQDACVQGACCWMCL